MTLTNNQTRDVESILHPYTNHVAFRTTGALVIEGGKGCRVRDETGKEYIEAMAGLWCTALGWGEEALAEAAAEQMRSLAFGHLFAGKSHEPAIRLAEALKDLAPMPVGKVFFANSGSEANDTQIKLAWYAANAKGQPQKKKILSRMKAYHGVTLASASLTGLPVNHTGFDLPFSFALHAACPDHYREGLPGESEEDFSKRLAGDLDAMIQREGPETIAAMIAEPVMGAGGVILPPKNYFEHVMRVLARHGIPLIDDEVITGFGRTGEWFGCQAYGFQPDSMSVAKALSSAYLPISAVLLSPEMTAIVEAETGRLGNFGHGFTYSGHPVAAAVALKTLEIYKTRNIIGHVRRVSPLFLNRLAKLGEHELVGEAKGIGLLGAIQLVADKKAKRFFDPKAGAGAMLGRLAEEEGVIPRALMGDRVAFCPPLVIAEDDINELFDRFERALARFADWSVRENLIA